MDILAKSVAVGPDCFVEHLPDGEAVLLNRSSERYFGLDEVGVQMWLALTSSPSIEDAYLELLASYEAKPDQLRADLERLVAELVSHELLEISPH